ncbi:unnamed protein product [Cyclocybe aegerita]|uniref:Uncharacterized protein n=1 Tax=Cyclocybe aegerita TaxID=1973307 RepID=A0A8S0XQ83_CYCAE|nr:unnamed protein product [Cyclocybe aegerita]
MQFVLKLGHQITYTLCGRVSSKGFFTLNPASQGFKYGSLQNAPPTATMSRNTAIMKNPTNPGPNLRTDLEQAFAAKTLSFQGTFSHSAVKTDAPNPVLTIDGLGTIGLPLNERDASTIIASMTPKPSGKGKKGKAAKDTREAWEVEAAKITFGNGEWTQWLEGTICREVWTALGVQQYHNSITKLVLRCVLLSKGSHTLSNESSQRPEGSFATAVIFLPSQHTGGQVTLLHSSVTKSFDDAPKSITSTTLLTWYNAVQQQVQPIESGYRLALVYNVVQPPVAGVPLPSLPDTSGPIIALRNVLNGWEDGHYESSKPKQGFLAYLLQHSYDPLLMPSGSAPLMQLKGPDKYRVEALQQAASELEFLVGNFLARLPALASRADQPATVAWCKTQSDKLCSSYNNVQVKEIPTLLDIVKVVGFKVFTQLMMPNLVKAYANYDFCIALVKALTGNATTIAKHEAARAPPVFADAVGLEVKKSVKEFLQRAAAQWLAPEPSIYGLPSYMQEAKASLPISHKRTSSSMKESFAAKLDNLHLKLIPHLSGFAKTKKITVYTEPIAGYLRQFISHYLHQADVRRMRQAGRVHARPQNLDGYLQDAASSAYSYEDRCGLAKDLCTYETIRSGSPYAVKITKRPEIVRAGTWEGRQQEAKAVLAKIGTNEEIQAIMGQRWKDVQNAIEGVAPFVPTPEGTVGTSTTFTPSTQQPPAAANSLAPASRGVKRKL